MVLAHLERLAAKYPDDAAALHKALGREFLSAVTTAGAAAGGAAAAPGIGTALAAAANIGVLVGFFGAAALYVLALAELHGLRVDDVERRRTLLLAVLLGDSGAQVVRQAAERTGKHWGRWAAANAPRETIRAINSVLGRNFVTVYGTKQGILVIGRAAPFGIGAVIGGGGNLILGRGIIAAAGRAFGPPPSAVGAWRLEGQAAPEAAVVVDAEIVELDEEGPPALT